MKKLLPFLAFFLLLSPHARGCDACSCAASNLSNWSDLSNSRSALLLQTQFYAFAIDGYALADSITDQSLSFQTLQGLYRLNKSVAVVGGFSTSRTSLIYPKTTEVSYGWGNANLGLRYTAAKILWGKQHFFTAEGRGFLPSTAADNDPLNLSSTPLGGSLAGAWLMQSSKYQWLVSASVRSHRPQGGIKIGTAATISANLAYTLKESEKQKLQLITGLSHFTQQSDIDNLQLRTRNIYSGGEFSAASLGAGVFREHTSFTVTASLPIQQHLGGGTSEIRPYLQAQIKYSW